MNNKDLLQGLNTLAESAFPKKCTNCGRKFATAEQFLKETESLRQGVSGFKQSLDDNDIAIVEVYRNCPCGSTLMDFFSDRRDTSEAGQNRRKKFGELLDYLVSHGLEKDIARNELLKVLKGYPSEILKNFSPPSKNKTLKK